MTSCDEKARSHPKLHRLSAYWSGKCRGGRLPARADIDPVEIPDILPYVVLWDVVDGGRDFRIRLAGTRFEAAHGRSLRGALMSQLVDEMKVSPPWDRLARVLRERCPDFRSAVLFGTACCPPTSSPHTSLSIATLPVGPARRPRPAARLSDRLRTFGKVSANDWWAPC
jgi:hypothetical protein